MADASRPSAVDLLDRQFLDMRAKILSLAADMDRLDRAGSARDDERLAKLRHAAVIAFGADTDRAAQVQLLFSDRTEGPNA